MILSWGKPLVEFAPCVDGAVGTEFSEMPTIKQDTAKLATTAGTKLEGKGEGGEVVDVKYEASSYSFTFDVFVKKGDEVPIADVDGVIEGNYSVRLTPEDDTLEGFIIDKSVVSVSVAWSAAEGKLLTYTFDALKPQTGTMVKAYTKAVV